MANLSRACQQAQPLWIDRWITFRELIFAISSATMSAKAIRAAAASILLSHGRHGTAALAERGWRETGLVTASGTTSVFAGCRFRLEVISVAVRWCLRYGLSYRDVEELLAEREDGATSGLARHDRHDVRDEVAY